MLLAGTPGLRTTSSIWSRSHEGTSPARSPTTPSDFRASASFDHSMSGFRSFRATTAPRAARNLAAATPLRPAPMTRIFLPSTSKSPQLQRGQAQQREQDRDDEEAEDDLRLLPAALADLEVVVERGHLEDAAARHLEGRDLNHHRQRLDDVDAADQEEDELLLRQDADGPD